MLAAGNGHDTSVRLLIASGAKLDVQNNQGDTALIFAVRNGHASTARMLLAAKADLDLRNLDRASAKDIAEKLGDNNMVSLLTQRS
jgi:ankyrin repeat protein